MLTGVIEIDGYKLRVQGYDVANTLHLACFAESALAHQHFDYGVDDDGDVYISDWRSGFKIEVGTASVKMQQHQAAGKKSTFNKEAISRIGSLLRGAKMRCVPKRLDTYYSLESDDADLSKNYQIPEGVVTQLHGSVQFMSLDHKDLRVRLTMSNDYYQIPYWDHMGIVKLHLEDFLEAKADLPLSTERFYTLEEIAKANPHKEFGWLYDKNYEIVSKENLVEVCRKIYGHRDIIAFDTETTGLSITFKSREGVGSGDVLVGMVFSLEEGQAWYIPLRHNLIENVCEEWEVDEVIERYFKPILERRPLLCHNGTFDWKVMHIHGVNANIVEDTLILFKLSIWNHTGEHLALKAMAKAHLDRDSLELSDFTGGNWGDSSLDFRDLGYEETKLYACADTDNTFALRKFAKDSGWYETYGLGRVYEFECLFGRAMGYQEFYGHHVDISRIDDLKESLAESKASLYEEMREMAGRDFNPASVKDLSALLFEELNLPVLAATKSGAPSTDKRTLKRLGSMTDENGNLKYPIVNTLLKYRVSAQLQSNFTNKIDTLGTEDGYFFSSIQQFLETGRISVSGPNYQSYNDEVKKYITPRPGYYMLDADYSSVEYRILASMSGQENLVESFYDPDNDYHSTQASRMFGVPYELVTKALRSQSKGINFGIPYGMGDAKLGASIFGEENEVNTAKARDLRERYFRGQDKVRTFFAQAQASGVEKLYAETYFGRRRYFDKRRHRIDSIKRQAGNHPIQGTAADVYKIAMARLYLEVSKRGWLGKFLLSAFVHDEVVLEVHQSINPVEALSVLRNAMMFETEGWCPLYIGAGFGASWYEAKKTEIPIQVQDYILEEGPWGDWAGDTSDLMVWERNLINTYKADRVIQYLSKEEGWGKVMAPVENGYAHEVLDLLEDGWRPGGDTPWELPLIHEGAIQKSKSDSLENISLFGEVFGIEEEVKKAAYIPAGSVDVTAQADSGEEVLIDLTPSADDAHLTAIQHTLLTGAIRNAESGDLYIRKVTNKEAIRRVNEALQKHPGDKNLYVVDPDTGEAQLIPFKVAENAIGPVLRVYLQLRALF